MVLPPACDRARTWASLRLDDELSELEGALLDAHLNRCAACRAVVGDVAGATRAIRAAALEPIVVALPVGGVRGSLRGFYAAAATSVAAVLVATGLGAFGASQLVSHTGSAPKLHRVSAVASGMSEDIQLISRVRALRNERPVPGRIVWPV